MIQTIEMGQWKGPGFNYGENYVIDNADGRAIRGPWTSQACIDYINAHRDEDLYNASRYCLGKKGGLYPRTQAGDEQLRRDLEAAKAG